MKHSIRQRVIDPVTGLKVTKIETVNGELGSGIFDKNGKEIFENDLVKMYDDEEPVPVKFDDGTFILGDDLQLIYNCADDDLEVVGHVDD